MSTVNIVHCNVSNNQIQEIEWTTIQQRMTNTKFSSACFLQPDEDVRDIIRRDEEYLKSVDITKEQIADCLQSICDQYTYIIQMGHHQVPCLNNGSYIMYAPLVEDYHVCQTSYNGAQECPFKNKNLDSSYHGQEYGDKDVFIFNSDLFNSNKSMHFSSYEPITLEKCDLWFNTLLIHMIRNHGFFEGPTQRHRLEPKKVIDVLGIKPNVNYVLPKDSTFM
jgi:hypothetical protein